MVYKKVSHIVFCFGCLILVLAACQSGPALQADAGEDFVVPVGERPSFDGCASTGNIVNYKWTILEAPDTMPEDAGKIVREIEQNCAFTLGTEMVIEEAGEWVITLEVRDANNNTSTDTVTVQVLGE